MSALRQIKGPGLVEQVEMESAKHPKPRKARLRKWRVTRLYLSIILFLSVLSAFALYQSSTRAREIVELEAKLDIFVDAIVDRILLSNKKDKALAENKDYIKRVIRIAVQEAYKSEPRVPLEVLLGILKIESKFNPRAINLSSGATGMAQVMPAVWGETLKRNRTVDWHWLELHETETAIKAAVHIFEDYLRQTGGDIDKALLKYSGWANRPDEAGAMTYVREAKAL